IATRDHDCTTKNLATRAPVRARTPRVGQKLSALTTSPPALVAIAHQTAVLTVYLINRTEPSMNPTFTPPGWNELVPMIAWSEWRACPLLNMPDRLWGVWMCVYPPPAPQLCSSHS